MIKRFVDRAGSVEQVYMAFVDATIAFGAVLALLLSFDVGLVATTVACIVALSAGWIVGLFWHEVLLDTLRVVLEMLSGIAWIASMALLLGAVIFTSEVCLGAAAVAFIVAVALHYWGPDP